MLKFIVFFITSTATIFGAAQAHARPPSPLTDKGSPTAKITRSEDAKFILINLKNPTLWRNLQIRVNLDHLQAIMDGESESTDQEGEDAASVSCDPSSDPNCHEKLGNWDDAFEREAVGGGGGTVIGPGNSIDHD